MGDKQTLLLSAHIPVDIVGAEGEMWEKSIGPAGVQTETEPTTGEFGTSSEVRGVALDKHFISATCLINSPANGLAMLWDPYFPETGIGAISGSSDSGKSCFCRQLALAVTRRDSTFLDQPLNSRTGNVYFVSSEDDPQATAMLLKKQINDAVTTADEYSNLFFLFETDGLVENLSRALKSKPADLVIMDSFGDLFNGREINANSQVRDFLNKFTRISLEHHCFFLFIHHVGKHTENNKPSKHNAIGSQAFEAKMRIMLELRTSEEGKKLLSAVKGNYLPQAMKKNSLVLSFDESTLTFSMTPERISIGKTDETENSAKYNVDWFMIFAGNPELKKAEILERLKQNYSMPEGTARRYVDLQLKKVFGHFGYHMLKTAVEGSNEIDNIQGQQSSQQLLTQQTTIQLGE
jgi:RecA-family ATPase